MSQISQPVRIALLAVLVLAAAWFMLLRPHPPSSSPAPAPVTAPPAAPPATPAGNSSLPPGVAGLSRAVQHARDAVTASQGAANKVTNANPTAPTPATAPTTARPTTGATGAATPAAAAHAGVPATPARTAPAASAAAAAAAAAHAAAVPAPPVSRTASGPQGTTAAGAARVLAGPTVTAAPAAPRAAPTSPATTHPAAPGAIPAAPSAHGHPTPVQQVQRELGEGKVVVILFWNPNGSDDRSVHQQLRAVDRQDGIVAIHTATVDQVTAYGTVTSNISVLETPTIVIVNPKGQATTMTGLADAKAINQAVDDAEQAAGTDQMPQLTAFTPTSPRAAYVKRVNAMCARDIRRAGTFQDASGESLAQMAAWFKIVNGRLLNSILRAAPPASDGAFIDAAVGHERKAISMFAAAEGTGQAEAGLVPHTRDLLLQVQSENDRAGNMFSTYGLHACVGQ